MVICNILDEPPAIINQQEFGTSLAGVFALRRWWIWLRSCQAGMENPETACTVITVDLRNFTLKPPMERQQFKWSWEHVFTLNPMDFPLHFPSRNFPQLCHGTCMKSCAWSKASDKEGRLAGRFRKSPTPILCDFLVEILQLPVEIPPFDRF